jgi:hypothetical protein
VELCRLRRRQHGDPEVAVLDRELPSQVLDLYLRWACVIDST